MKKGCLSLVAFLGLITLNQGVVLAAQPTTRYDVVRASVDRIAQTAQAGTFVTAEKQTEGGYRIITAGGKRFVELDSSFKTSTDGPDLFVVLHRDSATPASFKEGSYLALGKLQKYTGTQRYMIPDGVNLKEYKSVAIWCKMFNATFGYAPLKG